MCLCNRYERRRYFTTTSHANLVFQAVHVRFWGVSGNAGNFLSRFAGVHLVFEVFLTKVAHFHFGLNRVKLPLLIGFSFWKQNRFGATSWEVLRVQEGFSNFLWFLGSLRLSVHLPKRLCTCLRLEWPWWTLSVTRATCWGHEFRKFVWLSNVCTGMFVLSGGVCSTGNSEFLQCFTSLFSEKTNR